MTTATQRDYYGLLGVSKDASQDEIRKAYLKLAHKYHPDKTGGDKAAEEKLKEVNEAYDTLKNPEKRKAYDETASGAGPFGFGGGFEGFADSNFSGATGFGSPFEDLLGSMFGGRASRVRTGPRPGNDLETKVTVSLEDASTGTSRRLNVPRWDTCGECGGTGKVNAHPCRRCGGKGRVRTERELSVTIPPGADTGTQLRIAGEGEAGDQGGPRGDLYVWVIVTPHKLFARDGNNVVCEVPVTLPQAALGAKIRVPTLNGTAELTIPEGTQNGARLRMRGLGLPNLATGRKGDEIVQVVVEIPTRLSRKQRELLAQFDQSSGDRNYPRNRSSHRVC